MNELYASILEFNKQMLLNGMDSSYTLILTDDDFNKLAYYMSEKFQRGIMITPESDYKNWKEYKLAGPGGYVTVKKGHT